MLFLFLKIRFIIFAFQCDNLIQQQIDLNAELDLAKKNLRAFESEMDKKVLELDVNRKQRKLEWLAADFEYHSHRKKLFLAQSKKCLIKELKSNFIHLVCFQKKIINNVNKITNEDAQIWMDKQSVTKHFLHVFFQVIQLDSFFYVHSYVNKMFFLNFYFAFKLVY